MNEIDNIPMHVAIIPDGNRRWAKKRNEKPWIGHKEGTERIEEIIELSWKYGIKCLSIWGSSQKNLTKRPLREKKALIDIYDVYFDKMFNSEQIYKRDVKINVFGSWREQFPNKLVKKIEEGLERTKNHKSLNLNFFLAYDGDQEMLDAVKNIVKTNQKEITKETIKQNLLTKDLPPVDYLIRTGGEPHLSTGFMMWDISNAQLYFTDKYFPDFDEDLYKEALKDYAKRKRRHGA